MEKADSEDPKIKIPVRPPKARPLSDDSLECELSDGCITIDNKIFRILLNCNEALSSQASNKPSFTCRQCGKFDHPSWNCPTGNSCAICSQSPAFSSSKQCSFVTSRSWSSRSSLKNANFTKISASIRIILQNGHKPSTIMYSSLISSYISQHRPDSAHQVLEKMKKDGVASDAICFNAVLDAWCEIGNMEKALQVLMDMKNSGCQFTVSTYNTVIKGWGITGKTDEALNLVRRMVRSNSGMVKPNIRTFNTLMNVFCEKGKVEEARNVIGLIKVAGLLPDTITYNTLVKAYGKAKKPEIAESIVREMQNAYLRPNQRTLAMVVQSYCDLKRMDEACAVVENMKMYGVEPNTVVFNILIRGYTNASEPELAEKVLDMMEEFNVKADIVSFSTVMNSWCTAGKPSNAREILTKMKLAAVSPDAEVFSVLAKGYLRARMGAEAEEIITEMENLNLKPNVITFTTIISCYCSCGGRMDDAMRVYYKMESAGIKANIFTYRTLIWGFSEGRNPALAEKMLKIMEDAGVNPDARCYDQVIIAWQSVGLWKEAQRVNEMKVMSENENVEGRSLISVQTSKRMIRRGRMDSAADSTVRNANENRNKRLSREFDSMESVKGVNGKLVNGNTKKKNDLASVKVQSSENGHVNVLLKQSDGNKNVSFLTKLSDSTKLHDDGSSGNSVCNGNGNGNGNGNEDDTFVNRVNGYGKENENVLNGFDSQWTDGALFEWKMVIKGNGTKENGEENNSLKRKFTENKTLKNGLKVKRKVKFVSPLSPNNERNMILFKNGKESLYDGKKNMNKNTCSHSRIQFSLNCSSIKTLYRNPLAPNLSSPCSIHAPSPLLSQNSNTNASFFTLFKHSSHFKQFSLSHSPMLLTRVSKFGKLNCTSRIVFRKGLLFSMSRHMRYETCNFFRPFVVRI